MKRKIIEIERDKCNGCGLCTTACAEGALVLDAENKAVLAKEIFCDGLGACLDVCPTGALKILEKEVAAYDPQATFEHVKTLRGEDAARQVHRPEPAPLACGCPGTMAKSISRETRVGTSSAIEQTPSELTQWPIQLQLISPGAPYFQNSDLLIAADCTAFALGSFHATLLRDKKIVIACPKLDNTGTYVAKLAELLKNNTIYSLTVVIMSVPCCSGLWQMAEQAVTASGKNMAIKKIVITPEGEVQK